MQSHPEYSMCMYNAIKLDCITGKETFLHSFEKEGTYTQKEQLEEMHTENEIVIL